MKSLEKRGVCPSLVGRALPALVVFFAVCLLLFQFLGLGKSSLSISFGYEGDGLLNSAIIQTVIEKNSYLQTERLGAPFGQTLYDFPMSDGLNYLFIWLLGALSQSWVFALNGFFLLTYPLVALSAYFAFRKIGVSEIVSAVFSILYAFLPYHLMRGVGHLLLAAYYMVPLLCWVIWDIAGGVWSFEGERFRTRRFWTFAAVCFLGSSTGVYYAFFAALALCFFSVVTWINTRHFRNFLASFALLAVLGTGTLINLLPIIVHSFQYRTSISTHRLIGESEIYGLKLAQLILPRTGHNFPPFALVKDYYNRSIQQVTENDMATLGVLGAIGLLVSLGAVFVRVRGRNRELVLLGKINGFLILVATIGGFAVFIGFALTTEIRAYNRVSVFVAFFSLLAGGLLLSRWFESLKLTRWGPFLAWVVSIVLLAFGIYDQVPLNYNVSGYAAKMAVDRDFFSRVERTAGPNTNVYQLPYVRFPESPPMFHMADYEHLRGYLNTKTLRWSYGAFKGSEGDRMIGYLGKEAGTAQFTTDLVLAGYQGVTVNRDAYPDAAKELESQLGAWSGVQPLESSDGRLSYFSLKELKSKLARDANKFALLQQEFADTRDGVYVLGSWISLSDDSWLRSGWSTIEVSHRWTEGREAKVVVFLRKPVGAPQVLFTIEPIMTLGIQTVDVFINDVPAGHLSLKGPGTYAIAFSSKLLVVPGINVVRLVLPNAALPGNGDERILSFALGRMKIDSDQQ